MEKGCLAKGLSFSAGGRKVPVCLQKKVNLPGRDVHNERVRQKRRERSDKRCTQ